MIKKARGFTLIELLVVILIISIVTSVALLSISRNENKDLESYANDVAGYLALAEEQAILKPNVLGLRIDPNQLQFFNLAGTGSSQSAWQSLNDDILRKHHIPDKYQLSLQMGKNIKDGDADENEKKLPQIVFSNSGDLTPFALYIGLKGKKPKYLIKGDADGGLITKAL